jgi:hypothetical protein
MQLAEFCICLKRGRIHFENLLYEVNQFAVSCVREIKRGEATQHSKIGCYTPAVLIKWRGRTALSQARYVVASQKPVAATVIESYLALHQ